MSKLFYLFRKHFWGWMVILASIIAWQVIVKNYRKPGSMTVIEAQAMDMSAMKAPEGSHPVAIEEVKRGFFESAVTYTGTVAPYTEQTVYPRVEGWLEDLRVYAGDKVRAGQILARLEAPDLETRVQEAKYQALGQAHEARAAQKDRDRMQAEWEAMQEEVKSAQAELEGARAMVESATKMVSQAEAEARRAQAELTEAQKMKASADADLGYWKDQIQRQRKLLQIGGISQQEFDMDNARYLSAIAAVEAAQAKIEAVRAEIQNAQAKYDQAKAELRRAQAEVRTKASLLQVAQRKAVAAQKAWENAIHHVEHFVNMTRSAQAAEATAEIFNRYREIQSPVDGVVVERLIHPGVLVSPGMGILKIAQMDKVRLQANVAEKDLESIHLGSPVIVKIPFSRKTFRGKVTYIFPAADPRARTAIVEALVPNHHDLQLGQYVVMNIVTHSIQDAISVPDRAIVRLDGKTYVWTAVPSSASAMKKEESMPGMEHSGHSPETMPDMPGMSHEEEQSNTSPPQEQAKTIYTCTMHPEIQRDQPGKCPKCGMNLVPVKRGGPLQAHRVEVTIGASNGERTLILSGLKEGDKVIIAGYESLKEGDSVTPTQWGEEGPVSLPSPPEGAGMEGMPGHGAHSPQPSTPPSPIQEREQEYPQPLPSTKPGEEHSKPPTSSPAQQKAETSRTVYTCPMHPEIRSDKPGNCPKCGMKLVPQRKGE